jgi:acyl dehydratase
MHHYHLALHEEYAVSIAVGDRIPEWVMESVSAERMRTMAAILRDPNPLHWDRDAVDSLPLGLGKRTINQGPLGLSYMINMLHAWAGPDCVRRIVMRFPQVVLDGERVIACGEITALHVENDTSLAECKIWLEHAERGVLLEGTATVALNERT